MIPTYTRKGPFFDDKYPLLKRVPALTLVLRSELTVDNLPPLLTVVPQVADHALDLEWMAVVFRYVLDLKLGMPKLTDHHLLFLASHD